jgi:hypothetical protein
VNHGVACLLATWQASVTAAAAPAIAAAEQDSRSTEQAFADTTTPPCVSPNELLTKKSLMVNG